MSSLYKLDVLYLLRSGIIKKHYDSKMDFEEKSVYDAVVLDVYGSLDDKIDDSILFNTYFDDYFNDWYFNKEYVSQEELDKIDDLLIFKGLLHFKGQTVSLIEFYNYTFGKYYENRYDLQKESDKVSFLEKLNGCLSEVRVAKVDVDDFIPRELTLTKNEIDWLKFIPNEHKKISLCDEIGVKVSTDENPLIFISGLEPCKIKKIKVEDGKRFTFVSISDLHLGGCLVDNYGIFSESKEQELKERLECFVVFKDKLIEDLRKNNIRVDGIIFVGDILNAVSGVYNVDIDREQLRENLEFSRNKIFKIIRDFNKFNGNCIQFSSDLNFLGYISGNHDNTLGRELFFDIMKEFGENVTFLGDGAGRIKINDEYILFNHPNSLDWGLPITGDFFKIRRNLEHDVFHFEEYFDLCRRKYELLDKLNLLYILGSTPRERIMKLGDLVNDDLMKNNQMLYEFYEPFITRGNGDGSSINPSCFEEAMRIVNDDKDPTITYVVKKSFAEHGFGIGRFIDYSKKNANINRMLEERHICFVGDNLNPTLSIIGHFHTRLKDGKRICHAKEDGSRNDGYLPVVVEEGSSFGIRNVETFSSTICCLDIKDGVIDKIELEPVVYVVKKENQGYQISRKEGTTSSIYVRKKTL